MKLRNCTLLLTPSPGACPSIEMKWSEERLANSATSVDLPIRRLPRTVTREGVDFCQSPSSLSKIDFLPTNIAYDPQSADTMISQFGHEINPAAYFVPENAMWLSGTKHPCRLFSCPFGELPSERAKAPPALKNVRRSSDPSILSIFHHSEMQFSTAGPLHDAAGKMSLRRVRHLAVRRNQFISSTGRA